MGQQVHLRSLPSSHAAHFLAPSLHRLARYLQSQETFVDFCTLHAGLPVSIGSVGTSLIPCQIHQRELAMHSPFGSKENLEAGVGAGRGEVGECLPRGPVAKEGKGRL